MSESRFDNDTRDMSQQDARQNDAREHDARGMERTPGDLQYEKEIVLRTFDQLTGEKGVARYLGSQC